MAPAIAAALEVATATADATEAALLASTDPAAVRPKSSCIANGVFCVGIVITLSWWWWFEEATAAAAAAAADMAARLDPEPDIIPLLTGEFTLSIISLRFSLHTEELLRPLRLSSN